MAGIPRKRKGLHKDKFVGVRAFPTSLWVQVKIAALRAGVTIPVWLVAACVMKIDKDREEGRKP